MTIHVRDNVGELHTFKQFGVKYHVVGEWVEIYQHREPRKFLANFHRPIWVKEQI